MQAAAPQLGRLAAGLTLGAILMAGCERDPGMPSGDALADCYRTIQRAQLALEVGGTGLSASDRRLVRAELDAANVEVLHAWSTREGVNLSIASIEEESEEARGFLAGVEAEAGLGEQDRLSERTDASAAPTAWRAKFDAALTCTEEVSVDGA
ncbi:MAG: hypothetical protein CME84_04000 [Henriciella sp.]|jgi:hypothetical protein|uniref:hypothetical protein n=1 Tax=Henriciella sp. TaxID=1968823 RepID=UPI000C120715|nr:hypothetical protein [Henriciella sp.]MAN73237.1 hypothetical protein [Henriciella sp.]MBF34575.1 hypothetical protein [Hyphomonadaceae bacterium]PHR74942.1 MAG: hypothetical protein COA64_13330 [Henriciella sp.]|tara:strand:- start:19 stop:477 length:459 start_codon:yes stop_codon:yes gene_type:complete